MQALILAAGMGKRLKKYTLNNTKCMVEVNGKKLIDRTITNLISSNIHKIIIVIGYEGQKLKNYLEKKYKNVEFLFIENQKYSETNNIYSLYLAKDELEKEDTILLESDIIFEQKILERLIKSENKNIALVAKYEQWMDGTVVTLDEEENINDFFEKQEFNYDNTKKYYKTANIYKLSKEFSKEYYNHFLEAYIKVFDKNDYYESVLKVVNRFENSTLKALDISDCKWYEIDDSQDLDIASVIFAEKKEIVKKYEERYGGYWRFNSIIDFCYLVNPYFPDKQYFDKIKYSLNDLLVSYPSGLSIQNRLAANMFNVDEEKIIVGNGAAELINHLRCIVKGRLGVFIPTFNEYVRCFPDCEIIKINTQEQDYKITKELIYNNINNVDSIAIINPDNPSGNFISYDDIIEVIEKFNKNKKYIIIDESFIDFAEESCRYTLIDDTILEKYPYLIVVKSISKSYGMPGIRLGILTCSNKEVLEIIRENMPVWNINSLGEYFLQTFNLFKNQYLLSCDKIAEERNWLKRKLKGLKNVKVYDSQANYIMCSLENINCEELVSKLLYNDNIYIKRLNAKEGFLKGSNFIRIAVRNRHDNEKLIKAMEKYL